MTSSPLARALASTFHALLPFRFFEEHLWGMGCLASVPHVRSPEGFGGFEPLAGFAGGDEGDLAEAADAEGAG